MLIHRHFLCLIFCVLTSLIGNTQYVIEGKIVDESNLSIPFAEIYVKDFPDLRTISDVEGNYIMRLEAGEYYLIFSAIGYESREYYLAVTDVNQQLNMQLFPEKIKNIDDFEISVKRRNIGREIVLKTVAIKHQIDHNKSPYQCDVYIRATDNKSLTDKGLEKRKKKKEDGDARYDDVDELKQKQLDKIGNMNMVEVQLQRNYEPPNKIKEVRTAYKKRGDDKYLYFTTTAKSNINFFQNIINLEDLIKSPVQSPISTAGILTYKYQLVEKNDVEGRPTLNKIKITSRNISASTINGFIWIEDSTWLVKKLEFTITKGNLFIYDEFVIQQEFEIYGDSMSVLKNQIMNYSVSYRKEKFEGTTVVNYNNYNFNPQFEKNFFSNELAYTTEKAYDRDSVYWSDKRLTPLTVEEQELIKKRDSIEMLFTKESYLDSIDRAFNKVTFWKVLWFGVDHRNRKNKTQWTLSSIAGMIRPIYIAGPRVGPDFEFFKKWDNEHTFNAFTRVDLGVLNMDVKGFSIIRYLYNPFRQGKVGVNLSHNYDLIRSYDAITQMVLRDNFIVRTLGSVYHDFEIFNGLYLESTFSYIYRQSLPDDTKFIHWLDEPLENNAPPPDFNPYNAFVADFMLRYTPGQKYMREPKRKVILGSKWPTLYVEYEKGIPEIFGSEVNHDYIEMGLSQTFNIATIGTSKYRINTGKFLNAKNVKPEDFKYHRRGDPLLFSNPLYSYQSLDSTLPTFDWYFESHYIHHFNGALINKIPFMKRTRITSVVGGGFLYIPEHNWIHYEIYGGLERIFKFAKRRLRIGIYGVYSHGNHIKPKGSFKVSFALLDERSMKFRF